MKIVLLLLATALAFGKWFVPILTKNLATLACFRKLLGLHLPQTIWILPARDWPSQILRVCQRAWLHICLSCQFGLQPEYTIMRLYHRTGYSHKRSYNSDCSTWNTTSSHGPSNRASWRANHRASQYQRTTSFDHRPSSLVLCTTAINTIHWCAFVIWLKSIQTSCYIRNILVLSEVQ